MEIRLSAQERALIQRLRAQYSIGWLWLAAWAAWLGPFCAFAVYGVLQRDWVAITIALAGFAGASVWMIVRAQRNAPLWKSIFDKVIDASDASARAQSRG